MSQSEDHWYLEENYEDIFVHALRDDFVEAHEIYRELDEMLEDPPTEYEIDRALDALSQFSGNVDIVTEKGGNVYDVSNFTRDDHEQIEEDWL